LWCNERTHYLGRSWPVAFIARAAAVLPDEPEPVTVLGIDEIRVAAMRGIGITLLTDLPHRRKTFVLWSPDRPLLDAALDRLRG